MIAAAYPTGGVEVLQRLGILALAQPGSHDRRLFDTQVPLNRDTAAALYDGFTPVTPPPQRAAPELEAVVHALTPGVRPGLATATALVRYLARLPEREPDGVDRSPGQVLAAGTASALERARLLAALAQLAGIAARICLLYRKDGPAFHAVGELRIMAAWSVFDPLAGQCFMVPHHPYASAWEIMRRAAIVDRHPEHGRKPTVDAAFYRTVAIANADPAG